MEDFSKARSLAGMIEYQTGSIVSKTIIDKSSGTVTLFAFDKGQKLSEHTAPYDALVYVCDGTALISINGKAENVKQGEMLIMPANVPHALSASEKFKMLLVMVKT